MQDNKERLENKDELVQDNEEKISEVLENQGSLFDNDEIFTEAMVVEKEQINIDSSVKDENKGSNGDTAIFTFAKDNLQNTEISHEELTVSDIESSAKEYYNANHANDIEDKVRELCNLANTEFSDKTSDNEAQTFEEFSQDDADTFAYDEDKKSKKDKDKKKKKKHGYVSNDDMLLLSSDDSTTLHGAAVKSSMNINTPVDVQNTVADGQALELENLKSERVDINSEPSFDESILDVNNMDKSLDLAQEAEPQEHTEEDTEKELFKALGADGDEDTDYLKKYEEMYDDDEVEFEYTSKEQDSSILMSLRKKAIGSMSKILFTFIACIACFYFEIAAVTTLPNPAFLEAGKFGVTYAMSMLQIMFVCAIFNLEGMKRAFKALRPSKTSSEAFAAVIFVVCTLHTVVSSLVVGNDSSLRSYCSVGCFALLLLSVNSFFKAQTTLSAFCIAASKKPKYSCKNLERTSDEASVFENYLDEDSTVVSVTKSEFVEGFFKKTQRVPLAEKRSFKRICISLLACFALAVVCGIISKDIYVAVKSFTIASLMCLPANVLLMTSLPFFKISSRITDTQTAFLGEAVCDAYDDTNVIVFDDTEVFPARAVKVSSIKTYENNRIDKVVVYMAKIFDVSKGPLSYVFTNSVHDADKTVGEAEIKGYYNNGICASIDGKTILVGQSDFMYFNGLVPVGDNIDETFVDSMGSIIYMAIDGVLAAKFYVKYSINNEFEKMLRSFYDAGVCVAVRTLDPSISTEFVANFLKGTNYPFAVINKGKEPTLVNQVEEKADSTIISLAGVHTFLKSFIKADKLRNIYRTNSGFTVVSAILGFIIAAAGLLLFESEVIGVLLMIILQIFWCVPVVLISAFSK